VWKSSNLQLNRFDVLFLKSNTNTHTNEATIRKDGGFCFIDKEKIPYYNDEKGRRGQNAWEMDMAARKPIAAPAKNHLQRVYG